MPAKRPATKKTAKVPTLTIPPRVDDKGARHRSGQTSIRVTRLTLDTVKRLQEHMPAAYFSYRAAELDDVIYRLAKAALGETTEEQVPV